MNSKIKNIIWSGQLLLIGILMVVSNNCKKEEIPKQKLSTSSISDITQVSVTCGGNITDDGGSFITGRGVCWNTVQMPTLSDNKTSDGFDTGIFTSKITGLTTNTTYYVRAYATNNSGTAYGNEISFILLMNVAGPVVADPDGNSYNSVIIGTQVWLKENLKTTKYNNGDLIGTTTPATLDISNESLPKYQWGYDGNESNVTTYGRLYTWYAVTDDRRICPTGWHVPDDDDWETLKTFLCGSGSNVAGGKLKEISTNHWISPNTGATNETGFTARPGGSRYYTGVFYYLGTYSYWWSTTENGAYNAWIRIIYNSYEYLGKDYNYNKNGLSVRCIKD